MKKFFSIIAAGIISCSALGMDRATYRTITPQQQALYVIATSTLATQLLNGHTHENLDTRTKFKMQLRDLRKIKTQKQPAVNKIRTKSSKIFPCNDRPHAAR